MFVFVLFKQKTAYEMRISDLSSDVCSSDLPLNLAVPQLPCARFAFSRPAFGRRHLLLYGQTEFLGLQLADFIAKAPRLLEFQIGCGRAHLLFQILDIGTQIMADHMRAVLQRSEEHTSELQSQIRNSYAV